MASLEDLSLIILNYNSYEDTEFCADRLLSFQSDMHIVIVDNMSPDGSYNRLLDKYQEEPQVDILQTNRNGGYSYGNNFGIRYAIEKYKSNYVGVLNPDVIINCVDVIYSMVKALDHIDKLAIVGASVVNADGIYNPNFSGWNIPTVKHLILDHFLLNTRKLRSRNMKMLACNVGQVDCVAGCFFIANSRILSELGFLDENVFLYNEENILGIKCKRNGYFEGIVLDQFYIHNHRHNKSNISFKKKVSVTNEGYQSRKYLCETYYSKRYVPFLFLIEVLNKIYLSMAYLKSVICKSSEEK